MSPLEFTSLDLPEPVMEGIRDAGFVATTAIQEAALPLALKGKDVAGQSQTGTGKTAAFLIAAFTRCLRTPAPPRSGVTSPRVLIIAPTRELVVQIEADAKLLGEHTGLRIRSVYGGIDYNKQREELRESCDLLVGTPGRLIDYLKQHVWSPAKVEVLVIDEADRMFDMGFIADLPFILSRQPKPEKRTSVAPKKGGGGGDDTAKATSIGELIKQKLGAVAVKGKEAKSKGEEPAEDADDEDES